jgi:hypothetical protein
MVMVEFVCIVMVSRGIGYKWSIIIIRRPNISLQAANNLKPMSARMIFTIGRMTLLTKTQIYVIHMQDIKFNHCFQHDPAPMC